MRTVTPVGADDNGVDMCEDYGMPGAAAQEWLFVAGLIRELA